jgi:hypothetical protein
MWCGSPDKKKKTYFHAPYAMGDHTKLALGDKKVIYVITHLENNVDYNNVFCIVV